LKTIEQAKNEGCGVSFGQKGMKTQEFTNEVDETLRKCVESGEYMTSNGTKISWRKINEERMPQRGESSLRMRYEGRLRHEGRLQWKDDRDQDKKLVLAAAKRKASQAKAGDLVWKEIVAYNLKGLVSATAAFNRWKYHHGMHRDLTRPPPPATMQSEGERQPVRCQ